MDYFEWERQRNAKNKWMEDNKERLEELAYDIIDRMDEGDLIAYAMEAMENDWADYPQGFEYEWEHYKEAELKPIR